MTEQPEHNPLRAVIGLPDEEMARRLLSVWELGASRQSTQRSQEPARQKRDAA